MGTHLVPSMIMCHVVIEDAVGSKDTVDVDPNQHVNSITEKETS